MQRCEALQGSRDADGVVIVGVSSQLLQPCQRRQPAAGDGKGQRCELVKFEPQHLQAASAGCHSSLEQRVELAAGAAHQLDNHAPHAPLGFAQKEAQRSQRRQLLLVSR